MNLVALFWSGSGDKIITDEVRITFVYNYYTNLDVS